MALRKLSDTDAFVVVDLDGAEGSAGLMRLAPKILLSGARELARSATYTFATVGMRRSGASGGINARPDGRAGAVEAFVAECEPWVSSGEFLPDPGKGLSTDDLAPLQAGDPRHPIRLSSNGGISLSEHLTGAGAVAAMSTALGGLEGRRIVIEGCGPAGVAAAGAAAAGGAVLAGVATEKGYCGSANGGALDVSALREAWAGHGPAFVQHLDGACSEPGDVWGAADDVLLLGSKMGVLNHNVAAGLDVSAVACLHPIPFTTRALVILQAAGAVVLADFVCLTGPLFAAWPGELAGLEGDAVVPEAIETAAVEAVTDLVAETAGHPEGAFLGACHHAESFLRTWRDQLPFGRPLAP
jgi:glutamate dehydrogenase/leucine dehydrogenase